MITVNVIDDRQFARLLIRLEKATRFTEFKLGHKVCDVAVDGILKRTLKGIDATGRPFKPLNPGYAAHKLKVYGSRTIGIRKGLMLDKKSMRGRRTISSRKMTLVYGTGQRDSEGIDYERAIHFSEERPFFSLDDDIVKKIVRTIEKHIVDTLGER